MKIIVSLLLIFVYAISPSKQQASTCYSCASTVFINQWQATGFPYQPTETGFSYNDDKCPTPLGQDSAQACANGVCVEASYVINGKYSVVRGCHATLMGNAGQRVTLNNGTACNFFPTTLSATVDTESIPDVKVGVRFCNDASNVPCNGKINSQVASLGTFTDINCIQSPSIQCYSCSHYLEGTCKKDSGNCEGAWCTKVEGKINGKKLITRGCAPFNPLTTSTDQFCVQLQSSPAISQIGNNITLNYDADQCFCNTDNCNGVGTISLSIFSFIFATILPIRNFYIK